MDDTAKNEPCLSPLDGPDWRWTRAGQPQLNYHENESDKWIARARALRLDPKSESSSPELRQAVELRHEPESRRRNEVQSLLLTRMAFSDIAERCRLPLRTIEAFAALFFDVRDRLRARDWIFLRAIGCGPWNGFGGEMPGALWRYAAYTGGVDAFDLVFAVTMNRPVPDRLLPVQTRERRVAEVRLRLATELWVALLTARTDADAAAVLKIRRQLRSLERKRESRPAEDNELLGTMEHFLLTMGERALPKKPRRTARSTKSKAADRTAAYGERGHPFDVLRVRKR